MDARRLGMGPALPQASPKAAAPGYLTGTEWDQLAEDQDWLEQALAYAAVPCKGVRGPLTRIRPLPARSRATGPGSQDNDEQLADGPASIAGGPLYRLADYLDQHGRHRHKGQFPPAPFWAAAADHALPGDQAALGDAAHARGLYRHAAQLHKIAAAYGNLRAVLYLANPPQYLRADVGPVRWAAAHVSLDDPRGVARLLDSLREPAAEQQATALLRRDPAAHVPLDSPGGVASCWTACGRRARSSRSPRWPDTPPPTSLSTTRAAWPGCWTAYGGLTRSSRSPRWPDAPPPTSPSTARAA